MTRAGGKIRRPASAAASGDGLGAAAGPVAAMACLDPALVSITSGVIRSGQYVAVLSAEPPAEGILVFMDLRQDGSTAVRKAELRRAGGQVEARAPVDRDRPVKAAYLLHETGGLRRRIACSPDTCFLDRLLSADRDAITRNIRWSRKIADYETLVFAARQSFHAVTDPTLKVHCLLPIGYQAIEHDDERARRLAGRLLERHAEVFAEGLDPEVSASLYTMAWHRALDEGDLPAMQEALARAAAAAAHVVEFPLLAYNVIRALLVRGFLAQSAGDTVLAEQEYRGCIGLFQASVPRFTGGSIVMFRELRDIYDCAFHAAIGLNAVTGGDVRTYALRGRNVAQHAIRVRSEAARSRMIETFGRMVQQVGRG